MKETKPIRVYLEKKWLTPFRILMLMLATPFIADVYSALATGVSQGRVYDPTIDEPFYLYVEVLRDAAFALLMLWFATFGSSRKSEN
ncbi:MAG: hypothetical protein QNJ05_07710 [Woeseiaceae bacterium]|nr:hypothetical protein [Woeseiaceae bacterium]